MINRIFFILVCVFLTIGTSSIFAQDGMKYFSLGNEQTKVYNWEKAIKYFDTSLAILPQFPAIYYNRGISKYYMNDFEGAFSDLNYAISLNPGLAEGYYWRAAIYNSLGRTQPALDDLNKAFTLLVRSHDLYDLRGIVYLQLGQFQNSVNDFNQALFLDPARIKTHLSRAKAYMGLQLYDMAISDAQRILDTNKYSLPALEVKIQAQMALKKYQEVNETATILKTVPGGEGIANYNLGYISYINRDHIKALSYFQDAVRYLPDFAEAHYMYGLTLIDDHKEKEACDEIKKAYSLGFAAAATVLARICQ
ncbi:MAG: tetratricopeptide repeat protein [Bacteroidota bacterium]|nr:tetratricopeptide repeat protein [Bacteroidota bacterium]